MDVPDALIQLDALGPDGPYRTSARTLLTDVSGVPVAEMSMPPRLYVQRSVARSHRAPVPPPDERAAMLITAGRIFATQEVGSLSAAEYEHLVSRLSGLPIGAVRLATAAIAGAAAGAYRTAHAARPRGAAASWDDPLTRGGCAVWTRRGDVLAVHAAGNHPGVHALWLEALALGYRVLVRPSRREPVTPHRLVTALREAGFRADQVMFLPTDHATAGDLVGGADLALVYGGDDVVARYRGNSTVLAQGPGRSKIVLGGVGSRSHLDTITESVSWGGGTSCVNATAVFAAVGPAELAALGDEIAGQLASLPSLPPENEKAMLPVQCLETAQAIERFVLRQARGATAVLGREGIVEDLGDGSAVLRPAVFLVDRPDAPQTRIEMPFPCVWVAPWSPASHASLADPIAPLRDTLVLTAIDCSDALVQMMLDEPTISNVYAGAHPTSWFEAGLPHDGYLGEFLMRTKALIHG
jgi:acyl-CoA reductase-like NAD-dependent aldehyde dehydrogenase